MTDRLTDKEIEEIRDRWKSSTEGPWTACVPPRGHRLSQVIGQGAVGNSSIKVADYIKREADARFIAHTYTDIPRILDEVEQLREENARLSAAIDHGQENCDTVFEKLRKELDRYREALTAIHEMSDVSYNMKQGFMACDMKTIAENALEGTEEEGGNQAVRGTLCDVCGRDVYAAEGWDCSEDHHHLMSLYERDKNEDTNE